MKIGLPFPNGHCKALERDKKLKLKGLLDKSLKDIKVKLKGITEEDILEIRQMIIDYIKNKNAKQ